MELADRLLVDRFMPNNEELRQLIDAHKTFEVETGHLAERTWLSSIERQQLRVLKKRKLRGRDRIEQILRGYRSTVAHS